MGAPWFLSAGAPQALRRTNPSWHRGSLIATLLITFVCLSRPLLTSAAARFVPNQSSAQKRNEINHKLGKKISEPLTEILSRMSVTMATSDELFIIYLSEGWLGWRSVAA